MEREENQRGVKKPQPVDPFVDALFERYARVDPERKMEIVGRLKRLASEIASALRVRYPEATERENQLRLASRTVDRATMIRAFGWDPTCEGTDARRGARRDYRGASSRTTSSAPTANGP